MVTTVVPPQSRFGHAPPLRPLERARGCDHGLLSFVIVTATIGDVATAAMQPTYLLAAICRDRARVGHGKPRCLSNKTLYPDAVVKCRVCHWVERR